MEEMISFTNKITKGYKWQMKTHPIGRELIRRLLQRYISSLLKMWKLGTLEYTAFLSHLLSKTQGNEKVEMKDWVINLVLLLGHCTD